MVLKRGERPHHKPWCECPTCTAYKRQSEKVEEDVTQINEDPQKYTTLRDDELAEKPSLIWTRNKLFMFHYTIRMPDKEIREASSWGRQDKHTVVITEHSFLMIGRSRSERDIVGHIAYRRFRGTSSMCGITKEDWIKALSIRRSTAILVNNEKEDRYWREQQGV